MHLRTRDVAANFWSSMQTEDEMGIAFISRMPSFACASDTGRWSIYCNPVEEMTAVAFCEPTLPDGYLRFARDIHTQTFSEFMVLHEQGFGRWLDTWREKMIANYAC
jgi:hypothetical protein